MIRIKRVYEPPRKEDGKRFLVDRLWPRGIRKADLCLDGWMKDLAPSNDLRRWFRHDPTKWAEFQRRYRAELKRKPAASEPLLTAARRGDITLLFSAQDSEHNNAVVLRSDLEARLKKKKKNTGQ